jgi:hypothetical protein
MLSKPNRTQPGRKKISLLMARAYRRIERENPEKLRLWNDAFGVLSRDHYILLLFWRQNAFIRSQRMVYLLGVLVAISRYLLTLFLFGKRAGMRRGEQAAVDKYIPTLSPWFNTPRNSSFCWRCFSGSFPGFFQTHRIFAMFRSINRVWLDEKSRVAKQLFDPQQLLEFAFRQHRHSQFFRLVILRSRVCAHYHIVRLLAH